MVRDGAVSPILCSALKARTATWWHLLLPMGQGGARRPTMTQLRGTLLLTDGGGARSAARSTHGGYTRARRAGPQLRAAPARAGG